MKKKLPVLLLFVYLFSNISLQAKIIHVLPVPQKVEIHNGSLDFKKGKKIQVAGISENSAIIRFLHEFGISDVKFDQSATKGDILVKMVDFIEGAYDYPLYGYNNEAYTLDINSSGITVSAICEVGIIRAVQTLTQLAEGYDLSGIHLEHVSIKDWPAFKLRGFMHDVGRSFMSVEMIKRHIDLLSRFKVNTFHWHMTENQAWRFEVTKYPQLTAPENMSRHKGLFYTQKECREVEEYAFQRGVIVIPEIDMPGHSAAFEKAMGVDMQCDKGKEILKNILDEVNRTFRRAPFIHIGADEKSTTADYVNEMVHYVQEKLGRKCVVWNPIAGVAVKDTDADMCQLWSTGGIAVEGKANIDCRYNYTNHFDVFADLVGIYKSTIFYKEKGDQTIAGTISACWNDRKLESENEIVNQNNFYANVIASTSRAWQGGGVRYIDNGNRGGTNYGGGVMLPNEGNELADFINWENRFLFHKSHSLKSEPIPYVKQTHVKWRISDAFPNEGDVTKAFPPEEQMRNLQNISKSFQYQGKDYQSGLATGAGIYLRHTWGQQIIRGFYVSPEYNQTAYAWTYVYSAEQRMVGAQIEFQNYSRSEQDPAPKKGEWDLMGSKVWINGKEVPAPSYENSNVEIINKEVTQKNENFAARKPVPILLEKGWNLVFLKLPYINAPYRLDKWMFTFVFTDMNGRMALDDLIYSPDKMMNE